jgi:TPR repeat protein
MKRLMAAIALFAAVQLAAGTRAKAGPWEDGMAAYNRGDYVPAMELVRPLARAGNAKAQALLGVMYRKGHGVAHNSARAFMWLSLAAARGDNSAKVQLREVSQSMSVDEVAQARHMMEACEASNFRTCEY